MLIGPKSIVARMTIVNAFVLFATLFVCWLILTQSVRILSVEHWQKMSHLLIQQHLNTKEIDLSATYPGIQIVNQQKLPIIKLIECDSNDGVWFEYSEHGRNFLGHSVSNSDSEFLIIDVSQQSEWIIDPPIKLEDLIIWGFIFLSFATVVFYSITRLLMNPLKKLSSTIGRVDVNEIPMGFSTQYRNDEFGILARILESKVERIKKFIEREQLFTRDASHELRTSISIIKNVTEELLNSNGLDGYSEEQVRRISNANFEAENTIKTLLLLAREEHEPQQRQIVNVSEVIENSIVQHAYLIENKSVEVEVDVTLSAKIAIQPGAFYILVSNLVSNAFQYTQQGQVCITFRNNVLVVSDTGPGIPSELEEQINEPFIKGENSTGFGIGLSIVKRLCETYCLRMRINKKDQKQGTIVSVFFD